MSCKNCCSKFFLTLLSTITLGCVCALSVFALVWIKQRKINELTNNDIVSVIFIVIACAALLLLIFAVYASIVHKGCSSFLLAIILLIFDIALAAAAVFIFAYKQTIYKVIGNVWYINETDPNYQKIHPIIEALQVDLGNCSGWDDTDKSCKKVVDKYIVWIGVGLAVFAVVLVVGVFLAFRAICSKSDKEEEQKKRDLEQPLSYGW